MSDPQFLVMVACHWERDAELVSAMVTALGGRTAYFDDLNAARSALESDAIDLVLADTDGGIEPLAGLLAFLDHLPERNDLPLVLLANADELPMLGELTARRFNAMLMAKPMGREQLAAAIESGLRLRARQREVRNLLHEVSASNDRLATANLALEHRRAESVEEARRKTRFLAAISHDIRTPVNALVLSSQLLRAIGRESPSATIDVCEIEELTEALLSNASALAELVNDLLDIARHDQGKLDFVASTFDIGEFLRTAVDGMRPLAEQKGLALILEKPPSGVTLRSDRVKLTRILQNLVANAIKFTDKGEVQVVSRLEPRTGAVVVEVRDTGVGIAEGQREGIFDEFTQLRNPERDRTKGTGLGLPICRRLATALGGAIELATPSGWPGSIFRVSLPGSAVVSLARSVQPAAAFSSQPHTHAHAHAEQRYQGDVLIVEDHEPSRLLLQRLLRREGLVVRTAPDGAQALHEVARVRPNLVLMDLMMPVMGGLEALRTLRAAPATADLVVVILTGDVGDGSANHLQIEGASAILSKPVEIEALHGVLDRYLTGSAIIS